MKVIATTLEPDFSEEVQEWCQMKILKSFIEPDVPHACPKCMSNALGNFWFNAQDHEVLSDFPEHLKSPRVIIMHLDAFEHDGDVQVLFEDEIIDLEDVPHLIKAEMIGRNPDIGVDRLKPKSKRKRTAKTESTGNPLIDALQQVFGGAKVFTSFEDMLTYMRKQH